MDGSGALLTPTDVRSMASRLGVRPTKTLGQNFVHDAGTIRRIVRTADLAPAERVLEVGPGLGSLTLGLLAAGASVVAVELDPVLAEQLAGTVARLQPEAAGRLDVVAGDALQVTALPGPPPTAFVANLPYNVAVPVLLTVLERFETVRHGVVMVQAEVADRLAAAPGSRTYGVPSVKARWFADVRRAGTVARSVFWPVPNVDSALVVFSRHEPPTTTASRAQVFEVVDSAFAQRRKMLRSALAGMLGGTGPASAVLEAAGVEPTARGETLAVADFARIAEAVAAGGDRAAPGAAAGAARDGGGP